MHPVMPVAHGTETAAPATPTPEQVGGSNFETIFGSINSGIMTVLIILGVLMVLSVIVLVALTALERAKRPHGFVEEDDEDDYFEPQPRTVKHAYHDVPDPEEIRYTQRMFATKAEEASVIAQEPIRLPAPPVRPFDQPPVDFSAPPRQQEPEPQAEDIAQRFVETARTRYTEAQSVAYYRPVGESVPPIAPPTQERPREQASVPRVFDYKKQPKAQPARKPSVTRVSRSGQPDDFDEE
ncbi:MAG: hypothetical protein R2912_09060 [Eubacteriales bacterium]